MSDIIKVTECIPIQGTSSIGKPASPIHRKIEISVSRIESICRYPGRDEECIISLQGEITNRLIVFPFVEMIRLVASKLKSSSENKE